LLLLVWLSALAQVPAPASGVTLTGRTSSSVSLSWTNGTGAARIVVARPTSGVTNFGPQAGVYYHVSAPGSFIGPGNDQTGPGNVVVFNGSGSSVTVTGLNAAAAYSFFVYEYNGMAGSTQYSIAASLTNQSTLAIPPSEQPAAAAFLFAGIQSGNAIRLEYPAAGTIGGSGYLLLYKEGSGASLIPADLPQNGTSYAVGGSIGTAAIAAVITNSSQTASNLSNISGLGHYTFFLLPFSGSNAAATNSFNTTGTIASRYIPSFSGSFQGAGGEAGVISSLVNISTISQVSQGVQVWQFQLSEGADADTLPTILRSITFNTPLVGNQMSWPAAIQTAALFIGSTPVNAVFGLSPTSNQLQFTNIGNVSVPDNGSLLLSLRISMRPNVNNGASTGSNNQDGRRFVFQISNANVSVEPAPFSSQLSSFSAISSESGNVNVYSVVASQLRFASAPPAVAEPFVVLSPAPVVEAVDAGGNRDIDFVTPVTLTPSGPALDGVLTRTPVSGAATFSDLAFTSGGTALLQVSAGSFALSSPSIFVSQPSLGVFTFSGTACTALSLVASGVTANLTFSAISSNTGVNCQANAAGLYSLQSSWGVSFDTSRYVQFSVTPAAHHRLNATVLAFDILRTAAGATNYAVRSSSDGYAADLGAGPVATTASSVSLNLPASFLNLSAPLTFRIYGWGGSGTGNLRLDNILLRGFVGYTQPVAPMRTAASGLLESAGTWEWYDGVSWHPATRGPVSSNKLTIQAAHTVSLGAALLLGTSTLVVDGVLDCGTQAVFGGSTLQLNGTVRTAHPNGLAGSFPDMNRILRTGSTVAYTGSGQAVTAGGYHNLDLSQADGPVFPPAGTSVSGIFLPGTLATLPMPFTYNGTAAQVVAPLIYTDLRIDNPAGLTLGGTTTATSLTLASGLLKLGAHSLSAATISGGDAAAYVVTDGGGSLRLLSVNGTRTFPVGAGPGAYTPLQITHNGGIDWSVRVQEGFDGYPATNSSLALQRIWHILPAASLLSPGAIIRFQYPDSLWQTPAAINVHHVSNGRWELLPNGTGLQAGLSDGLRTVTLEGQTSFSPFALAGSSTPLPVRLLWFRGRRNRDVLRLQWKTASESQNAGFQVERSADGRSYQDLGFVHSLAVAGNSDQALEYAYEDARPPGGRVWYRLRQIDRDGRGHYSGVVQVGAEKDLLSASVAGPARQGLLELRLRGALSGVWAAEWFAADGRSLGRARLPVNAGSSIRFLSVGHLPAGIYVLVLAAPAAKETLRFVVP